MQQPRSCRTKNCGRRKARWDDRMCYCKNRSANQPDRRWRLAIHAHFYWFLNTTPIANCNIVWCFCHHHQVTTTLTNIRTTSALPDQQPRSWMVWSATQRRPHRSWMNVLNIERLIPDLARMKQGKHKAAVQNESHWEIMGVHGFEQTGLAKWFYSSPFRGVKWPEGPVWHST